MRLPLDVAAAVSIAAGRHGLDPCLLAALVAQESSGDTDAVRFEPRYHYLWDVARKTPWGPLGTVQVLTMVAAPPSFPAIDGVSADTEWIGQRTSWGACQVMGAVARELGFSLPFFTALCHPDLGVDYGAKLLARLSQRWETVDALSAYNAGAPTDANFATYVSPILQRAEFFRREGF